MLLLTEVPCAACPLMPLGLERAGNKSGDVMETSKVLGLRLKASV